VRGTFTQQKYNHMNRRKFITATSIAAVAPTILLEDENKAGKKNNMFVHHVLFYLHDNTPENRAELIKGLKKLTKIKSILMYNIGVPTDSDRDVVIKDYSISWLCFYKDEAAESAYQVDPIHLAFVEDYKHLWSGVKVFDTNAVKF
jgi:hypothetical protein